MVLNSKDMEKIQKKTRRLFYKYRDEYNLNHSEATGKVIYELENVFEKSIVLELTAYNELIIINEGYADIIKYLQARHSQCVEILKNFLLAMDRRNMEVATTLEELYIKKPNYKFNFSNIFSKSGILVPN